MLRITLALKASEDVPKFHSVGTTEVDGCIVEGLVEGYEASWVVDADEDFMLETAFLELIELDVLEGRIKFGSVEISRVVDVGFMALVPHLPSLGAFLLEKSHGKKEIYLFEHDINLHFFFRQGRLVVQAEFSGSKGPVIDETEEESGERLLVEVCDALKTFKDAVKFHLPKLDLRKEYQAWSRSQDSIACAEVWKKQGR